MNSNNAILCSASNKKGPTALIMAGGTGGHIFPGLAVAEELLAKGWTVNWLGSIGGMEQTLVENYPINMDLISIAGLRGNGIIGWIKAPFTLLSAIRQANHILKKQNPNVVLGFGGFASGPGGFAAFMRNKVLFIHEQNAVAGMTNRILSLLSKRVFLAFPNAISHGKKVETIGNPIRSNIKNINKKAIEEDGRVINLLIIGGSRGAQVFNQKLPSILSSLVKQEFICIRHQCGKENINETTNIYAAESLESDKNIVVTEFIDDMREAYQWADLIICRSGALTVSEIAAVGIAAVFIPYPFAVDDHQTRNAEWLVDNNAAIIVPQSEIETATTKQKILSLVQNPIEINTLARNAKKIAYLDASQKIVEACNQAIKDVA